MTQAQPTHTALIVEDVPLFAELLCGAVALLGDAWENRCFADGTAAVDWLNTLSTAPSMGLIDLGLPDMNGVDVVRALAERWPDTPVLVVTVMQAESSLFAAIQAGAKGYVLKDDSELSITRAMSQVLKGQYPISPTLSRYLFNRVMRPSGHEGSASTIVLTPKQHEVLQRFAQGESYDEVAAGLGVSLSTVQHHVRELYQRLHVRSQTQALAKARKEGLI